MDKKLYELTVPEIIALVSVLKDLERAEYGYTYALSLFAERTKELQNSNQNCNQ